MGLLDLFFPKYCVNCKKIGDYLCPDCFVFLSFDQKGACLVCTKASIDGLTHPACTGRYAIDAAFASLVYAGVVKKLLYVFKYQPYVFDLKDFLTDLFYEGLIQKEEFYRVFEKHKKDLLIIPVPLHKARERKRGYNQAEFLAKGLSEKLSLSTIDMLTRVKEIPSQVGLSQKDRKKNIKGVFEVDNSQLEKLKQRSVFLVDDILTTGATLSEAASVLKRNGATHVFGLTLARG